MSRTQLDTIAWKGRNSEPHAVRCVSTVYPDRVVLSGAIPEDGPGIGCFRGRLFRAFGEANASRDLAYVLADEAGRRVGIYPTEAAALRGAAFEACRALPAEAQS